MPPTLAQARYITRSSRNRQDSGVEQVRVEMSTETAAELRARGGHLYIWDYGPKTYCKTEAPDGDLVFDPISGDGWTVHVQRQITPPSVWVIRYKRFPRKRFEALYEGDAGWGLDVIPNFP